MARSVCCRGSAARDPPVSSANRSIEAGVQLGRGHHPQPGRGQLDGQRDAIQPPADPPGHLGGRHVPGQRHPLGGGAVGQQPHRLAGPDRRGVVAVGRGAQRRHPVHPLPADAQRLTAGRQQRQVRAVPQQRVGELGASVDEVLAVVQHHQQAALADRLHQRIRHRAARLQADAQHIRHRHRHQLRVAERGQVGEPHPLPSAIGQPGRHLQPQPGLARPARPSQRHQPRGAHQRPHRGQLHLPADEARHLRGQVGRQLRVAQRPQRRERRRQFLSLQLEDLPGLAYVLQPVHAQILQPHSGRQRIAQQFRCRGRHHHLAPIRHRRDPGRPVHLQPGQPRRCLGGLPVMDAHPDPYHLPGRPRMRQQRPLRLDRRIHTGPRHSEHRENPIPLADDLLAAVRGQGPPDQPVMIGQHPRPRVPQPLRHRGGTLDVGEQECERLRGHSPTLPRRGRRQLHRPERPPASSTEQRKHHTSTTARRNDQHDCAGSMAESAIDARPDQPRWRAGRRDPGSGGSGDDNGSSVDPAPPSGRHCQPGPDNANGRSQPSSSRRDRMTASAKPRPLGCPCRAVPDNWGGSGAVRALSRSAGKARLSEQPRCPRNRQAMIINRFVSRLCPILEADWEWRSAASCGQMRSGAAIVAAPSASDVLERHQAAALVACVLSSGRRGRRFKSGHLDGRSWVVRPES